MEVSPRVFISYSHDSPQHEQALLSLANRLREDGIDAWLDQYEPAPKQGWPRWMEHEIDQAAFVLMVCTQTYLQRVMMREQAGKGLGVLWEASLIYQHLYDAGTNNAKFIPVLPSGGKIEHIPTPVRGAQHYFPFTEEGYRALYRRLVNEPAVAVPSLGKRKKLEPVSSVPVFGATAAQRSDTGLVCTNSPRAAIVIPEDNVRAFIPVVESGWDERQAKLVLEPDTPEDGAFLDGLRGPRRKSLLLGYRNNAGTATVQQVQHSTTGNKDRWEIAFLLQRAEFSSVSEITTQGLTPDQGAERRARRILLNEAPHNEGRLKGGANVLEEFITAGFNNVLKIEESPFPGLFKQLGQAPQLFLESAWILAVLQLKLSATVQHVTRLELTLLGDALGVQFSGHRPKFYSSKPAFQIDVSGTCNLAS